MDDTPAPASAPQTARVWLTSDKPLARIARNMLWLMSGKGVGAVLSLVYLGIATRTLGVVQFGQFALILSMGSAIALLAQFDSWRVVIRFGAGHLHAAQTEALGRLVAACRIFDILGFLLGAALAWGATELMVLLGLWEREGAWNGLWYCLAILASIRSTPMGVLRLHRRFDLSTYAETMVPAARMVGAIAVLLLQPDVTGFLIAWAASEMASAVTFWLLAWRIDPDALAWRHSLHLRETFRRDPELASFLTVTNLGTSLAGLSLQAPVLMVGGFAGPAAAGLFRLAFQLSRAIAKIATLVARSTYAELSHVRASSGDPGFTKLLRKIDRIAVIAGAALMLTLFVLGKPILWIVAGQDFVGAYPILLILGLATAIDFAAINKEPALLAATNGVVVLRLRAVGAVVQLLLLAALLPLWQETGAAWALAGASLATNLMLTVAVRRHIARSAGS